jgi:N utilization substance protein A
MSALTAPVTSLSELKGVGPKTLEKLEAHGITSIERLADMSAEQLLEIPGIGEKMVEKIRQSVVAHFEGIEAAQAGAEAQAAASKAEETPAAAAVGPTSLQSPAEPEAQAAVAGAEASAEAAEDSPRPAGSAGHEPPSEPSEGESH